MSAATDVPHIHLQRVYDVQGPFAHPTFLVDWLWPRGVRKERLEGAQWLKEVAPSTALRQAFHAAPDAWDAFVAQYRAELHNNAIGRSLRRHLRARVELLALWQQRSTAQSCAGTTGFSARAV